MANFQTACVAALATLVSMIGYASAQDGLLARGRYLERSVVGCGNCHSPRGPDGRFIPGREFAGGVEFVEEPFTARAANITPDRETGIGRYTTAQLITAIREGKRPDGSIIGPPMPITFYRGMSDSDVRAIAAYVRSVRPVRNQVARSEYRIPLPPDYGPPVANVRAPRPADRVAYGAYIAGPLGHCVDCHTPLVQGRHAPERLGSGGLPFNGPWGVSVSRNITPHPTGLARWSDAEIERAIRTGVSRDSSRLKPPMAYDIYANMNRGDMAALIAYLRTLRPLPLGGG